MLEICKVQSDWFANIEGAMKKKLQFSYKLMSVNYGVSYLIVRFEAKYVQDVTISHQVLQFSCCSKFVICMYIVKYFPLTLRYAGYTDKHTPSQCWNCKICWSMRLISKIQKTRWEKLFAHRNSSAELSVFLPLDEWLQTCGPRNAGGIGKTLRIGLYEIMMWRK